MSLKVVGLFTGVGGIELGFEQAGFKTVWSNELDQKAAETFKLNFRTPLIVDDIRNIKADAIPDCDVIVGGFPCQAFSQAGLKKGFEDTRGTLFFDIERIINEKKPKAFLLENVKNLKNHDKGKTFKIIEKSLKNAGYTVFNQVLKARDFGVPQNRERIYIVGFRNDLKIKDFRFPEPLNIETSVGDILEKDVDEKYTISDKLWAGHQRRKKEHKLKGNGFGYSLFNKDSEYTNTITARYYKDGSEILIEQKNKNPRKLTPKECFKLQGYPDNFKLPDLAQSHLYKQAGNSVCVPLIKRLAVEIKKAIYNTDDEVDRENLAESISSEIKNGIINVIDTYEVEE